MSGKIFPGPKIRRLREQQGLTQAEFARSLGISASYLNQIENNQRPLTAAVLIRLSGAYEVDLHSLSDEDDDRLAAELRGALGDEIFQGQVPDLRELREVVALSPALAGRFMTLYHAYRESAASCQRLAERLSDEDSIGALSGAQFPYEEVRDYFWVRNNYVGELDQAAEQLQAEQNFAIGRMEEDLAAYLRRQHGVSRVLVDEGRQSDPRHFDRDSGTLYLSGEQPPARRAFHLAFQICLLDHGELMDRMVADAGFASGETAAVCRIGLANYFSGALIMPYTPFLAEAKQHRYDIEKLELRFGVTFESVCHRLSTLQRPGAKGVPFYFVRVDMAGNISKRQSASSFHFARSGGACPLWNVHEAFSAPGKILTQLAEMPDGKRYFCVARTVTKAGGAYLSPQRRFAVGLGCEIEHAHELVYSAGVDVDNEDAVVPIGPSCRVCEREHCVQRAFPPIGRRLTVNENRRAVQPYAFA